MKTSALLKEAPSPISKSNGVELPLVNEIA